MHGIFTCLKHLPVQKALLYLVGSCGIHRSVDVGYCPPLIPELTTNLLCCVVSGLLVPLIGVDRPKVGADLEQIGNEFPLNPERRQLSLRKR